MPLIRLILINVTDLSLPMLPVRCGACNEHNGCSPIQSISGSAFQHMFLGMDSVKLTEAATWIREMAPSSLALPGDLLTFDSHSNRHRSINANYQYQRMLQ